jgi:hypothetical protein
VTFDFTSSDDPIYDPPSVDRESSFHPPRPVGSPDSAPALAGHDLAALVSELFGEGSLSWPQLCALANLPELRRHLAPTVANAPACRKPLAAE